MPRRSIRWCRSISSSTTRVIVNFFGDNKAFGKNVVEEYKQNQERYEFLKWGQKAFSNFSVVPPGTGICHQVNLEYLAQTVWTRKEKMTVGKKTGTFEVAYPDSLVGTDSHTTMVNGLAVLGWGVGGIEAEAAMLGQPLSMLLPEVVGFKLKGQLKEGVTATDLVLTVTQMLRKQGVVGKFVEFFGPGLDYLSVADKATIGNMAPEYGATCGFFPVDAATIDYLKTSGRKADRVALVTAYAKAQGLFRTAKSADPVFTETLTLDLGRRGAVDGRTEASRRPRRAAGGRGRFRRGDGQRIQEGRRRLEALCGGEPQFRSRPWRRGDRGDHLLHQHLQSERADRRGTAGAQRRRQGPERKALGQDLAGAGQPGGRGISLQFRTAARSRQGRLQPDRLRLHHLHRQFRSAAGRDFEVDQRQRHHRRRRAVG